jgi:hypothetical protein
MRTRLRQVGFAVILVLAGWTRAGELAITSPTDGAIIKGAVRFTAAAKDLPAMAGVDWELNGRSISGCLLTPPDFALSWHPAQVFDGPMSLQAIGRDATGKVVAASQVVRFTADGGPGDMKLLAPADLSRPLSGTVAFTVEAVRPLSDAERQARLSDSAFDTSQVNKTVECIQIFVDGNGVQRRFGTPTTTLDLDTTRLPNGAHELQVSSYAWFKGVPPVGMLQVPFRTENGRRPMALLPRWQELFLQPGETADLAPQLAYTDGSYGPLKAPAQYEGTAAAVATVDAAGRVTAVGRGVATMRLSLPARALQPEADEKAAPYTAEVRVVVGFPPGLPHFARNGRQRLDYDPQQSLFVRSMFSLSPKLVLDTPGLAVLVKDAGISTCESGFFHNPNDGNHIDSLEKYIQYWDPWFDSTIVTPARKLGLSVILSGDDWVRTMNELKWTASTPWALDLARHIWTRLRDSGVVTAVEMMDEASFLGAGPAPTDGHWAKADPAIHDQALVNLIAAIHSVADHTPISWPVLGLASPEAAQSWMGDPRYADYASQYWTTMDWRLAYPWGTSGPQLKRDLDRVMLGRFPLMQWDRPQLMLVSGCGPFYTKRAEGDHFQPGFDEGLPSTPDPAHIAAQPLYAALSGAAGVRTYSVDFTWKGERARAKLGARDLQTGTSPFGAGSDRWHALAAAYTVLGRLEPWLLQPPMHAVALGADFSVGARGGKNGRLLLAIQWSQRSRTVTVDLTPYRLPGVKRIERYRVRGGSSSVEVLPEGPRDTVTFEPGEFVAWLVRTPRREPHLRQPDLVPPAVRLVLPYEPTVAGPLTLRAEARDDRRLQQVEFFVNGESLGIVTKPPYVLTWDGATTLPGEWHGLKAVATDAAGNQSEARAMARVVR